MLYMPLQLHRSGAAGWQVVPLICIKCFAMLRMRHCYIFVTIYGACPLPVRCAAVLVNTSGWNSFNALVVRGITVSLQESSQLTASGAV